jgi:hypothetical protein
MGSLFACTALRESIILLIFTRYYQDFMAIVDIFNGEISGGSLPTKQTKLVLAWTEIHKEELIADWELASKGELPFPIEPLK